MTFPVRPLVIFCLWTAAALPAWAKHQSPAAPAVPAVMPAAPVKAVSRGVFHDSAGQAHSWSITSSHLLEWEGSPYLPAGDSFTPRYWVQGQTDDAWNVDVSALQALKQHGVTDLSLNAGTMGLTKVDPAAVQRLLDYLDAQGFQYGLDIADFPKDPLVGYTIEPSVFRNPSPQAGANTFSHVSGLQDALYFLVSSTGDAGDASDQLQSGTAEVTPNGSAVVNVQNSADGEVLLLYPRRAFGPGTPESHLPDLWHGYDEYRDRLLAFFGHIKLGHGFRFFVDPLTDRIGMNGEVQYLVPTGERFHLDFQAWLNQKYARNMDSLNNSWGLGDQYLPDFATAARVVPLWYQFKGLPDLYDPDKSVSYPIGNAPRIKSRYWDDLEQYKLEATRGYMNAIADALKHGVADVPVVYTWTQHSPLFTNPQTDGGYDGLSINSPSGGADDLREDGAYAYAQAQETSKTTWLIAGAAAVPANPAGGSAFSSQTALDNTWDSLKSLGARGFFVSSWQESPAEENKTGSTAASMLTWLGAYATDLQEDALSLEDQRPSVLWYPQNVAGPDVNVRRLSDGVWWLPTFNNGQALRLGPSLLGYDVVSPDDSRTINVLWTRDGSVKTARFDLTKQGVPQITSPAGTVLPASHKGDVWTIPVSATPTVVQGISMLPLSLDAADDADLEAQRLVALATKQHVSLGTIPEDLFRVDNDMSDDLAEAGMRYDQLESIISVLDADLTPFTWIEGESPSENTFTSVTPDSDASGGAYLSLDTDQDPPPDSAGYAATYTFSVNAPATYTLWLAVTPSDAAASAFTWQMDDGVPSDGSADPTAGGTYAGKFAWTNLGNAPLRAGRHTLTIHVTGRRSQDQRYRLDIDALNVTRIPFQPNGPLQPALSSWLPAAPAAVVKKHGRHSN